MPPNTPQSPDQDSGQDQLENEQLGQPLIQPQNTYPRFLSSTLGFFQQMYHSVVPSIKNVERIGKRFMEEESPSAASESEALENCDIRPRKRLKEAVSTTRVAAHAASTSWSTEQLNTAHNTTEDEREFASDSSALGTQHYGSNDLNALRSDYCEAPENCTSAVPGPKVAQVTTHKATSFQGAHDFTIRDNAHITNVGVSNVSVSNYGRTFDLDIMERFMEKYVSLNAIHDSPVQDPDRKCHPETRRNVLKQIHDWADNRDGKESIFWLHGPAGSGKSAIAQTIAHSYSRQKVAATFFFFKSDPGRNDGNKLFTTIAWQLALLIPDIKSYIINSLSERPDLPKKDIETQFQELIVKPLQALTSISSQTQLSSLIIIIDGVDECIDEKLQRRFLTVIGNAVNDPDFPLRFLICSRPEVHIEETIDRFQCAPLRLNLAKLDDAHQDIERYLRAEFSRIALEQEIDTTWPGDKKIRECVYKSSGHFVYASTLIKILDDEFNSAPTQLDIILGLKPHSGTSLFAELDGLYMEILNRQRDWAFLNDTLSLFTGCWLSRSFGDITYATIMNIPWKELCRKLRGMRSLLTLDHKLDIYHQSFLDFLQDSSRSGQYHITKRAAERRCLDLITASIVRHAPLLFEQPNCHERLFYLLIRLDHWSSMSVEELQEALQPLMNLLEQLLTIERASWQHVLRCKGCNILSIIRDFLLYLTCIRETSKHEATHPAQAVEQNITEQGTPGPPTSFVLTEVEQDALEKSDLDICLSSVLDHLRETKLEFPLSAMIIDLMCSLLDFDHVETAMRVRSISDGQLLVDFIDCMINNEEIFNQHNTAIARRAACLALEIHARVPVLPCPLFCASGLPQRVVCSLPSGMFTSMFVGRILDSNYVLKASCMSKEGRLKIVHNSMDTYELIEDWRRSNPSSIMMLRVLLELAKAVQYFDSMGLVLDNIEFMFLDSECHVKIFPWCALRQLTHLSSEDVQQSNTFKLGITFYELYFDVRYPYNYNNNGTLQDLERPSEPEISDELWQIIRLCCVSDPKSRPTIDEVVQEMESWKLD